MFRQYFDYTRQYSRWLGTSSILSPVEELPDQQETSTQVNYQDKSFSEMSKCLPLEKKQKGLSSKSSSTGSKASCTSTPFFLKPNNWNLWLANAIVDPGRPIARMINSEKNITNCTLDLKLVNSHIHSSQVLTWSESQFKRKMLTNHSKNINSQQTKTKLTPLETLKQQAETWGSPWASSSGMHDFIHDFGSSSPNSVIRALNTSLDQLYSPQQEKRNGVLENSFSHQPHIKLVSTRRINRENNFQQQKQDHEL